MRISFLLVTSICMVLQGCIIVSDSITVPHANYKLEIPKNYTKSSVLDSVDKTLRSLGFTVIENDWKVWEPLLKRDQLIAKKQERRYKKDDFELFYGALFQSNTEGFIRLSFYEKDSRQFSNRGIDIYYKIKEKFSDAGLAHLDETDKDVRSAAPIVTPEEFNRSHPKPPLSEKMKYLGLVVLGFIGYILFALIPGWLLIRKSLKKLIVKTALKRVIFATISSLTIFPAPIPMSMFGPMLLAPGALVLPFIFGFPAEWVQVLLITIAVTWCISLLAAYWLVKSSPDNQFNQTPGGAG